MKKLSYRAELQKRQDVSIEPAWASKVERWYQLDEMGFAFCEALHTWDYLKDAIRPDLIILAIEGSSNRADKDFVTSGSNSPAKFVYTLPNISAAIIFQMLKVNGKVYCLSNGKDTVNLAAREAQAFAESGKNVWVFASPVMESSSFNREIIFSEYPS
jgi:hypothetical protein